MKRVLTIVIVLFASLHVFSENEIPLQKIKEANDLYAQANYIEAKDVYEEIINNGYESFELYYNLANAYYRMNEVGNCIYYYEKAKLLNPTNEDIDYNLELAKLRIESLPAVVPELAIISFIKKIIISRSVKFWGIISLSFFLFFLVITYLYIIAKTSRVKKIRFLMSGIVLFFVLISVLFTRYQNKRIHSDKVAIVISEKINATSSPDETSTILFNIYEGYKVYIEERSKDWCEVKLTDGKKAWIKIEHLKVL